MHKLLFAGAFSMVLATAALAQTDQNLNALPGQPSGTDQQSMGQGGQMPAQRGGNYQSQGRQGGSHQMKKRHAGTNHVQSQKGTYRMQGNKHHRRSSKHHRSQHNAAPSQTRSQTQTRPQY
jgi:hypothetical protein